MQPVLRSEPQLRRLAGVGRCFVVRVTLDLESGCAVEHHIAKGRQATLTPKQLAGWQSLQTMVNKQSAPQK